MAGNVGKLVAPGLAAPCAVVEGRLEGVAPCQANVPVPGGPARLRAEFQPGDVRRPDVEHRPAELRGRRNCENLVADPVEIRRHPRIEMPMSPGLCETHIHPALQRRFRPERGIADQAVVQVIESRETEGPFEEGVHLQRGNRLPGQAHGRHPGIAERISPAPAAGIGGLEYIPGALIHDLRREAHFLPGEPGREGSRESSTTWRHKLPHVGVKCIILNIRTQIEPPYLCQRDRLGQREIS